MLRAVGIGERRPLDFCTPYGCSKGGADAYVLDFAKSYGLPAVVFRMSCIYGQHQHGNEDQGWVAHFLLRALAGEPLTIYGDGAQVRDILFATDLVDAMLRAHADADALAGTAFNVGGGPGNTISLLELLGLIEELHGVRPEVEAGVERTGDQRWYVSDTSRLRIASVTSVPSRRTRSPSSIFTSRARSAALPGLACSESATARYIAPESRYEKPSSRASSRATVLLPAPAGPSIATTMGARLLRSR